MCNICKLSNKDMSDKMLIKKIKHKRVCVLNILFIYFSYAQTLLGNSLTLSPSMEEQFLCAKVIQTEVPHS